MIGGVLLAVTLVDRSSGRTQTINVKFKILESGKTDWVPIIIGGMVLDHEDRGGLGLRPEKHSFYLTKLRMSIERCERFTRGRYYHPPDAERVEDLVFANRSEVAGSPFDSDIGEEEAESSTTRQLEGETSGPSSAAVGASTPAQLNPEFARQAKIYDSYELDELVLDTSSVVVPTGSGAWVPVRRRRLAESGEGERTLYRVEDRGGESQGERQPPLIASSEIAVPLLGGPEIVTGIWPVGADHGSVIMVNTEGEEFTLTDGDRVAAVMPAALQTRMCTSCGMVDTDGFVSDVEMCESCGTLVAGGPSPCAGCGAGVEYVRTQI